MGIEHELLTPRRCIEECTAVLELPSFWIPIVGEWRSAIRKEPLWQRPLRTSAAAVLCSELKSVVKMGETPPSKVVFAKVA